EAARRAGGTAGRAGGRGEGGWKDARAAAIAAPKGKERSAGHIGGGADRDPGHRRGQWTRRRRAHRAKHRLDGPERPIGHATLPASAAATASWSLNGNTCLPMIWPVSWPLPAISSTSPRRRSAIEFLIASRRSPVPHR